MSDAFVPRHPLVELTLARLKAMLRESRHLPAQPALREAQA